MLHNVMSSFHKQKTNKNQNTKNIDVIDNEFDIKIDLHVFLFSTFKPITPITHITYNTNKSLLGVQYMT